MAIMYRILVFCIRNVTYLSILMRRLLLIVAIALQVSWYL